MFNFLKLEISQRMATDNRPKQAKPSFFIMNRHLRIFRHRKKMSSIKVRNRGESDLTEIKTMQKRMFRKEKY